MSAFSELIAVASLPPINVGLHSATEQTMISILGRPAGDIDSKSCKNQFASETVKRLQVTKSVGRFKVTGLSPAVDSLAGIFDEVRSKDPDLLGAVGSAGMLCVRLRRPTSGVPSTKLSNHAWGTAIDISIDGSADTKPDGMVQRGIALLIPFFNRAGWFSGVGFKDDTHFEVADETIHAWAQAGKLG